MTQAEFDKITIGSKVRYTIIPQFVGEVVGKASVYNGIVGNFLRVDFPPNDLTHGGDPEPMWLRAEALGVISYADGDKQENIVPEAIKVAVDHWITYTESLLDEMETFKGVWFT